MRVLHERIADLVGTYGYTVSVIVVALESFGIPLPDETGLVTAAAIAAFGRRAGPWDDSQVRAESTT